jgi:hypothetical protein
MDSTAWERTTMTGMRMRMMKGTPPHLLHLLHLLLCMRISSKRKPPVVMVPEEEAHVAHEVILADAEPEPPQPHLFSMIMRHYEESPPRMENGLHELDDLDDMDDPTADNNDVDEWFPEDGSNDRD